MTFPEPSGPGLPEPAGLVPVSTGPGAVGPGPVAPPPAVGSAPAPGTTSGGTTTGGTTSSGTTAGGITSSGTTAGVRAPSSGRSARLLLNVLTYAILAGGLVLTLAPFVLSVMTAFKSPGQFASQPALTVPAPATIENFLQLFSGDRNFWAPIVVTAQVVLVAVVGQLGFSVLAAYAFARIQFPLRDALFWVYLATMMVPQVVTIIPLYTLFSQLGLRNTFWALVLPFVFGSPYAIFLLREYFRSIPEDLISAARLDGAGTLRILFSIVLPLSRPILATLTIITVVSHWNNFLWPLIITSGRTWQTVTVATAGLQSQYNGNWTLVMAATTIAMAPLLVLFAIFQRNIISSIAITGFK